MADTSRRFYRSRKALAGGVCAGIAERLGFDAVVVRILTVLLSIATCGLAAVAYAVAWAVAPLPPRNEPLLEVRPQKLLSDTYGVLDRPVSGKGRSFEAVAPDEGGPSPATGMFAEVGHIPPAPPAALGVPGAEAASDPAATGALPAIDAAVLAALGVEPAPPSARADSDSAFAASPPPMASTAPLESAPAPDQGAGAASRREPGAAGAQVALWVGSLLLSLGLMALLGRATEGASWWQFWPLVFVVGGLGCMVVPGRRGWRMARFAGGLSLASFASVLLAASLRLVGWQSLALMAVSLWPLLLAAACLFAAGGIRHSWPLLLAGGVVFAMFCFAGLTWFCVPGDVEAMAVSLPFGRTLMLPFEG